MPYQLMLTLLPFRDVSFFNDYYRLVNDISQRRPSEQFTKLKLLLFIISLKSIHFLLLYQFPLSDLSQLLHYDIVTLFFGPAFFNISVVPVLIGFGYLIFYFHYHSPLVNSALLYKIVLQNDCTFFIYKFEKNNSNILLSKQVNDRVRGSLITVYNSFQGFRTVFQLFLVFSHILIFNKLKDLTEFNPYCEKILYNAVILLTGGVMVYLAFSIVTFISLMISVGLAQLNVLLIKLKQLHHYLKLNGDTLTSFQFTKFKASQLSVFPYFTEYNTVYGRLLVVFVIANTPTNIFFVCTLIFNNGQTTVIGALYMFVYSIVQVLCIFAVQYYFVQFSRNFHAPSYLLNRLQIRRMHRMGNLRMRFQMANFVNAFLSVHLYGITYDRFGLVTMKALVLVSRSKY